MSSIGTPTHRPARACDRVIEVSETRMMATLDISGVSQDPLAVMAYLIGENEFEYVSATQNLVNHNVTMYVWDKQEGTP
jgi:hypothetical protein